MKSALQKIAIVCATLLLCLAIGEVALRLFTPFPITESSNKRPHPILGYVMDPAFADIDGNGFRNKDIAIKEADLAVIGDSHAYGYNSPAVASFPSVIARKTGRKVYNFGVGSYGVYQYAALLDMYQDEDFQDVLVALFIANDLSGYCAAISNDYWRGRAVREGMTLPECRPRTQQEDRILRQIADLVRRSATGSAFRHMVYQPLRNKFKKFETGDGDRFYRFPGGQAIDRKWIKNYRIVRLEDPAISRNFENSKRLFGEAADRYAGRGIRLSFLFIPSPVYVVAEWSRKKGYDTPYEISALATGERLMVNRYKEFFDSRGIRYADALPKVEAAFEREIAAGRDLYPITDDHPRAVGYEAYADAAIEEFGLLQR